MHNSEICHLVSLATGGGIETLFAGYLEHSRDLRHIVVSESPIIHSSVEPGVRKHAKRVHSRKHTLGTRIPKFPNNLLRSRRLAYLSRDSQRIVLWNRIRDTGDRLDDFVYYDHGSAWSEFGRDRPTVISQSRKCVSVSTAGKFFLEEVYGARDVEVVQNPVCIPGVRSDRSVRKLNSSGPLIIGAAARLSPAKNVAVLLDVMVMLEGRGVDCQMRIAGEGGEMKALRQRADELGIAERVILLGHVTDMAGFYEKLDLFAHTSLHESFGLSILEAAAFGVPVVAPRIDGIGEFIVDGENGILLDPDMPLASFMSESQRRNLPEKVYSPVLRDLVDPKGLSAEQISTAIIQLVDDSELYASCSRNNIDLAKRHSLEKYVREINVAFQSD